MAEKVCKEYQVFSICLVFTQIGRIAGLLSAILLLSLLSCLLFYAVYSLLVLLTKLEFLPPFFFLVCFETSSIETWYLIRRSQRPVNNFHVKFYFVFSPFYIFGAMFRNWADEPKNAGQHTTSFHRRIYAGRISCTTTNATGFPLPRLTDASGTRKG